MRRTAVSAWWAMTTDRFGAFLPGVSNAARRALEELRRRIAINSENITTNAGNIATLAGGTVGAKVNRSGDTMTGDLILESTDVDVVLKDTDGVSGGSMNAEVRFQDANGDDHGNVGFATSVGIFRVRNSNGRIWIATGGSDEIALRTADTARLTIAGDGTIDFPSANFGAWTDVTFVNSWLNYGSPFQNLQFRKIGDMVYVRGMARKNTSFIDGNRIFTLPSGFRPPASIVLSVRAYDSSVGEFAERVTIDAAGDVKVSWDGNGNPNWVSFHHSFSVTA